MKIDYINIYNNLIKLTTNKSLYKHILNKQDDFSDRLTLFLLHFAFILKEFKNDEHINVEVINAGIKGGTTNHELDFIKSNLTFLEPDLIIMYDGWNDSINVNVKKTIPVLAVKILMTMSLHQLKMMDEDWS